ncbi:hypothetical protein AAZX31_01G036800 [Glycine max]
MTLVMRPNGARALVEVLKFHGNIKSLSLVGAKSKRGRVHCRCFEIQYHQINLCRVLWLIQQETMSLR